MNDAEVILQLADLGMDELSVKALPLLPLVQVAWADGAVQPKEAVLIEQIAEETWEVGTEGMLLLKNWLRYPPTASYVRRGRAALLAVAAQGRELDESILDDVQDLARKVAKAAGGLFGIGAVSRSEADALDQIAKALRVGPGTSLERAAEAAAEDPPEVRQRRVTIDFSNTATLATAAQGGVLEPDPLLGAPGKVPVNRSGITIGTAPDASLRVEDDPDIAPHHARVFERNRKFYVEDNDTASGTWVNGERIAERRLLGGEVLRMGQVTMVFKRLRKIPKQMVE